MANEDKGQNITESTPASKQIAPTSASAPAIDQKTPENFWQAVFQIVWKWKPRWRNFFLAIVAISTVLYLVWTALPENVKYDVLRKGTPEQQAQVKENAAQPQNGTRPEQSTRTSTITFHDYWETTLKLRDRFLESEEFSKGLIGAQVTWVGYVDSVGKMGADRMALMIRTSHEASFPGEDFWVALVVFDDHWQTKLYSLRRLDKVRVIGIIRTAGATPQLDGVSVTSSSQ